MPPIAEPIPEPVAEPEVIPEQILEEVIPEHIPEPAPPAIVATVAESAAEPVASQPTSPVVPTLVIDTEPSVRFTDFNQLIRENQNGTEFQYVEHSNKEDDDDDDDEEHLPFMDEDGEPLSDFEDLDATAAEPLSDDDFETL